ncbi:hypothetical protein CONLIGDRAFT_685954 [Coniochaeta ligniaria NRRL 30616]|uniref:Uncharacterized protein n=1 Tax=Coniochaeta ligniaria NRRL 30616 TaxID=1408157 RepID=A0A1J7IAK1_9PEZI|nr:hypothetical protein CONLIGDRAFT_685954 [Coniochaeta ligniaria NRRL 30616]
MFRPLQLPHPLYQRFSKGNDDIEQRVEAQANLPQNPPLTEQFRPCKVTAAVLLLCLMFPGLTDLGDNLASIGWFTFCMAPHSQGLVAALVAAGELGKCIELRHGTLIPADAVLLFSPVFNLGQHSFCGPSSCGRLSDVHDGLLGQLWTLIIWLVVCLSEVVGQLGFGHIATFAVCSSDTSAGY